jgi:predicted NAD-dependent protein-ADP-ribosyltransferase YbiA (DUF1768 family)
MSVITFNSPLGPYGFLSNNYMSSFYSKTFNVEAKSVQHLLQAAKFWWEVEIGNRNVFDLILSANTCADAKVTANNYDHRSNCNWNSSITGERFLGSNNDIITKFPEFRNETMETYVMIRLVREKFQSPGLRRLLYETGNAEIVFDSANDRRYGKVNGVGKNLLGVILTCIRHEIAFLPPQHRFPKQTVIAPVYNPPARSAPTAIVHQPIVATAPQPVPHPTQVLGNSCDAEIVALKNNNNIMLIIIVILVLVVLRLIQ